ncbi:hypothetical protein AHF37_00934 [Paragonimus kellicotti]|nr:hypothetical protein AHF37_00934 [Paragonimus kellicotti]
MGPHGAPPASSAPGGPFTGPGQPYNGPPFAGSGPPISTTGGPPFNAPGPAYGAPTSGRPFTGPPGPQFSGPHAPAHCGPQGGSNFTGPCGPPSNSGMVMPNNQDFGGPNPTHSFNGPPFPGPPFSNMCPFSAPPPSMPPSGVPPSGPPSVPPTGPPMPPTGPAVQQNLNVGQPQPGPPADTPSSVSQFSPSHSFGVPSGPPLTTSSTAVTVTSNSTLPPMCPPPVPHPPVTSMSPGFGFHSSLPMPEVMPFAVPPGFPTPPGGVSRPMVGQPPMPHQPLGPAPTAPFHMMPPPVSTMPMIPPSMPPFRPPIPFMPPMPISAAQHNFSQKTDDIWVENLTAEGKSYYYNMRTRETRWDRPDGVAVVRQGEVEGAPKPANTAPSSVPVTVGGSLSKPPDVAVWSEYHNPEGKAYYYNTKTGETTWEKPKVLLEWGEQQEKVTTVQNTPEQPSAPVATSTVKLEAPVVKAKSSEPSVTTAEPADLKPSLEIKEDLNKKVSAEKTTEASVSVAEKKEEVKTPKDNSRPVSSTAVPGTPWCVVWTGDDRAFFFNPSQRLSVWEKPEELKGRVDVDRLLEKQPTKSNVSDGEKNAEEQTDQETGESAPKKPRMDDDERVADSQKDSEILKNGAANDADLELDKTAPLDKIPVGMEAAREAEERAARERAVQPLEVRVRRFREMLVSAFSTWEKELHKIVFDPRYLLLASKERKQTFEAYVKERAEEERREKKNKLKERKEKFVELLQEAGLTSTSSFNEFSAKYAKDERFKGIEKSREREAMFQDMLAEVRKREKDEKHREKEKVLKHLTFGIRQETESSVIGYQPSDSVQRVALPARTSLPFPTYAHLQQYVNCAVFVSVHQRSILNHSMSLICAAKLKLDRMDFVKIALVDGRQDSRCLSAQVVIEPSGFSRFRAVIYSALASCVYLAAITLRLTYLQNQKTDFLNLLKEQKYLSRHSHWGDIKRRIDTDPRYKAVDSSSRREDWFRDFVRKLEETPPTREDSGSRKEREKKERQEASLREREREVKEALSTSLKERDKEREQQLHSEQEQNFRTLLTELVRDPNITWKETKKILRKDARWELISDVLQRSERDDIFKEHLSTLSKKSRDVKLVADNDVRDRRHSLADADDRVDEMDKKVKSSSKDSSRR